MTDEWMMLVLRFAAGVWLCRGGSAAQHGEDERVHMQDAGVFNELGGRPSLPNRIAVDDV